MYCHKETEKLLEFSISLKQCKINKDIFDGNFNGCELAGKDLTNAYLPYGKSYRVNLHQAQLRNTILNNSQFDHSNLSLADLEDANLYFASLFKQI